MDEKTQNELQNLMNDPLKRAEALMPGYEQNLEKIIDQIISSAKTKFNYSTLLSVFHNRTEEDAEIFADFLLRAIVIEFGISLDKETGLENCVSRLRNEDYPLNNEDITKIVEMLFPVLKKEFGAIQKLNYLSRELTQTDVIIEKISKEVEIKSDELGLL